MRFIIIFIIIIKMNVLNVSTVNIVLKSAKYSCLLSQNLKFNRLKTLIDQFTSNFGHIKGSRLTSQVNWFYPINWYWSPSTGH